MTTKNWFKSTRIFAPVKPDESGNRWPRKVWTIHDLLMASPSALDRVHAGFCLWLSTSDKGRESGHASEATWKAVNASVAQHAKNEAWTTGEKLRTGTTAQGPTSISRRIHRSCALERLGPCGFVESDQGNAGADEDGALDEVAVRGQEFERLGLG